MDHRTDVPDPADASADDRPAATASDVPPSGAALIDAIFQSSVLQPARSTSEGPAVPQEPPADVPSGGQAQVQPTSLPHAVREEAESGSAADQAGAGSREAAEPPPEVAAAGGAAPPAASSEVPTHTDSAAGEEVVEDALTGSASFEPPAAPLDEGGDTAVHADDAGPQAAAPDPAAAAFVPAGDRPAGAVGQVGDTADQGTAPPDSAGAEQQAPDTGALESPGLAALGAPELGSSQAESSPPETPESGSSASTDSFSFLTEPVTEPVAEQVPPAGAGGSYGPADEQQPYHNTGPAPAVATDVARANTPAGDLGSHLDFTQTPAAEPVAEQTREPVTEPVAEQVPPAGAGGSYGPADEQQPYHNTGPAPAVATDVARANAPAGEHRATLTADAAQHTETEDLPSARGTAAGEVNADRSTATAELGDLAAASAAAASNDDKPETGFTPPRDTSSDSHIPDHGVAGLPMASAPTPDADSEPASTADGSVPDTVDVAGVDDTGLELAAASTDALAEATGNKPAATLPSGNPGSGQSSQAQLPTPGEASAPHTDAAQAAEPQHDRPEGPQPEADSSGAEPVAAHELLDLTDEDAHTGSKKDPYRPRFTIAPVTVRISAVLFWLAGLVGLAHTGAIYANRFAGQPLPEIIVDNLNTLMLLFTFVPRITPVMQGALVVAAILSIAALGIGVGLGRGVRAVWLSSFAVIVVLAAVALPAAAVAALALPVLLVGATQDWMV